MWDHACLFTSTKYVNDNADEKRIEHWQRCIYRELIESNSQGLGMRVCVYSGREKKDDVN